MPVALNLKSLKNGTLLVFNFELLLGSVFSSFSLIKKVWRILLCHTIFFKSHGIQKEKASKKIKITYLSLGLIKTV